MNATTLPRPVQAMPRGTESAYRPLQHEFHFAAEAAGLTREQRSKALSRLSIRIMGYLVDKSFITGDEVRRFVTQSIEEVRGC